MPTLLITTLCPGKHASLLRMTDDRPSQFTFRFFSQHIMSIIGVNFQVQWKDENAPAFMHLPCCAFHRSFAQLTSSYDVTWRLDCPYVKPFSRESADRWTDRQTDGTDSITPAADAGGNNEGSDKWRLTVYLFHHLHDGPEWTKCCGQNTCNSLWENESPVQLF